MAPSSNLYPQATSSASSTPCIGINSNSPSLGQPIRIVFSASLEKSLLSSGKGKKRTPSALRSSSSWTSGHPSRGRKSSTGKTASEKQTLDAPTSSTAAASPGRLEVVGGNARATTTATRRYKGSETGGGGATCSETIIDTNSGSRSPEGQGRHRQDLHDPSSKERPSAAVPGIDGSHGLASKEQARGEKVQKEDPAARQGRSIATATKQQQQNDEQQHLSHSIPRGRRSGRGTLPAVKCWEKGAEPVASGGKNAASGGESQAQRPRGRPARSRSYVDTISPQRVGGPNKASGGSLADGTPTRNRMEAGSAGVAAAGRNGVGIAFGRESSSTARFRQQGRGEAGGRAAFGGGGIADGGRTPAELLDEERKLASSSTPPPLLQLPASPSVEDEENLSVCSSLPPMTGAATNTTDLIFEESSFEDSGASVSQASSTERTGNDTRSGGAANGELGGASGRGRRGGGGGNTRQRSSVFSDDFVRTRCDRER